jgi:hypothetical protein
MLMYGDVLKKSPTVISLLLLLAVPKVRFVSGRNSDTMGGNIALCEVWLVTEAWYR